VTHSLNTLAELTKQCPYCGRPVVRRRRTAKWCSESCRVMAWRRTARQTNQGDQESRNRGRQDVGDGHRRRSNLESRNLPRDHRPTIDVTVKPEALRRSGSR